MWILILIARCKFLGEVRVGVEKGGKMGNERGGGRQRKREMAKKREREREGEGAVEKGETSAS